MLPIKSRFIWKILRWVLTLASLLAVLWIVDIKKVFLALSSIHYTIFGIACLVALIQFISGAWRWQKVIKLVSGKIASLQTLFFGYIVSFYVSSVLPGTITGDFVRMYDSREIAGGSAVSAMIVILERTIGLIIIILLGIISWALISYQPMVDLRLLFYILIGILLLMLAGWVVWRYGKSIPWTRKIFSWSQQFFDAARQIPALIRQYPRRAIDVLFGSLLYQLLSVSIVYCSFLAARVEIPFLLFLAVSSVVSLFLFLPISIYGIGVRESLYLAFLVPAGMPADKILAGLAISYLIGLPFILWGWYLFQKRAGNYMVSRPSK